MYWYLAAMLKKNGIPYRLAAECSGLSERRFLAALHKGSFSVSEAFLLRNSLFPECDVSVLFSRSKQRRDRV